MGGEEHRLSLLAEVLEDVLHLAGALGVEANRWFVEEEHLRIVEQGGGQRDLLPHTPRVAREKIVAALLEVEQLEQGRDPAVAQPRLDVVEVAGKLQELARAQLVVEGGRVRHVADPGLRLLRLGQDVDAR